MKRTTRKKLSNLLIGTGLALILAVLVYEAANYPWRTLFGSGGELADPDPPAARYVLRDPSAPAPEQDAQGLPEEGGLLAARPDIELTLIGYIKLPALSVSENIVEGVGDEMLYGVGHLAGTAYPGEEGNCALAGHRNSVWMHPFRHLDKLKNGDTIVLEADGVRWTYEVFDSAVVEPDESWVTAARTDESHVVTLITCTPLITYTHRLVVWGRLISTETTAAAE